jgi:dihydrodipicolinate synthase/N-acetylneuraminate lyase
MQHSTHLHRHFFGVVAAFVTPCSKPGEVDAVAAGRLAKTLVENGCDGLFVSSSTGESVLLDEDDRRVLTTAVRNAIPSTAQIYAGISGFGLKQTLRIARNAQADGANAVVAMAPFFQKFNQNELIAYFTAIADESPLPVALYHHPRMVAAIEPDTVATLAVHPNIVAIKDTSPEPARIQAIMKAVAGLPIQVFQGNESLAYESYKLGSHGTVTALAGVVPEWHAELYRAATSDDAQRAISASERITNLWRMFRLEVVGTSISAFAYSLKLAMHRRGWLDSTEVMMPGFVPSDELKRQVIEHLVNVNAPAKMVS